jgi:hypothetical protein
MQIITTAARYARSLLRSHASAALALAKNEPRFAARYRML